MTISDYIKSFINAAVRNELDKNNAAVEIDDQIRDGKNIQSIENLVGKL